MYVCIYIYIYIYIGRHIEIEYEGTHGVSASCVYMFNNYRNPTLHG